MPTIFDNIENHFTKGLNECLKVSNRTDFCVGYFNLRGWKEVTESIEKLEGSIILEGQESIHRYCRLLVGMQKMPIDILKDYFYKGEDQEMDQTEAVKLKKRLALEFKDQLTIGSPTEVDEAALRKLSRQLKEKKVVVKLHLRYPLHAKLYLAYLKDRGKVEGFVGSSNLTLAGLSRQGELNINVEEQDAAKKLVIWFEDRWKDRWCMDITEELIQIIDESWAADRLLLPYHIYLKMAYHLSQEARAGLSEFQIPKIFQNELFEFQQEAVKMACKKLEKREGILIGDVVGLGKTITACAIAKVFEEKNFTSTLIICPPNLELMWKGYIDEYDLKATTLSLGKVVTEFKKLPGRFRLVIIDESHNLRNNQGRRYTAIKDFIKDMEPKVLLLSATPYNKTYLDLSNQLQLFLPEDKDLGVSPERYVELLGGSVHFEAKHTAGLRTIKAFENSEFPEDWHELMRLFMVRRTRSFIKNHYTLSDPEKPERKYLLTKDKVKLYFPDRIPKVVEYEFDVNDKNDIYAQLYARDIVTLINRMRLPRYGLGNFSQVRLENEKVVQKNFSEKEMRLRRLYQIGDGPMIPKNLTLRPTPDEIEIIRNLSRAGKRLMGFCRTNLFKRLESSGYSFLLSLARHVLRNYIFVYAYENQLPFHIGKNFSSALDFYIEDQDDNEEEEDQFLNLMLREEQYLEKAKQAYTYYQTHISHKFDWINSTYFHPLMKEQLIGDAKKILRILRKGKNWNPQQDKQLNALENLLSVRHKKEKVVVFTQFADTAKYLTDELKKRKVDRLEIVTGNNEDPAKLVSRFSPESNRKLHIKGHDSELNILIATDVISEGQNLQDAHIVVNYDLPWAIIRLIQRAGRVDRIGQKADKIICYSFLPEKGIENIIRLRERLTQRISENAEVVGSDETFFEGDTVNLKDLYNEKSKILEGEEDDSEVDLSSYAYQIWKDATLENPELKRKITNLSNVVYATKKLNDNLDKQAEGVVVYTRTAEDNDVLAWVNEQGNIITQSQLTILKAAACGPEEPALQRAGNHHQLVKKGIDHIAEDERSSGGTLGKKTGIKYKVYTRLDDFYKTLEGTLFENELLKRALNDIFKYPFKEFARETLNRQLKSGITNEALSELVVSLREEGRLCSIDDLNQDHHLAPQIICSMGLLATK